MSQNQKRTSSKGIEVDKGVAKSNLTGMFSFSAAGIIIPPMTIYPYKRMREEIRVTIPENWGYGISDNGWMTKQTFYEYISKVFLSRSCEEQHSIPSYIFCRWA